MGLLQTVAAIGAVKAPAAEGAGMGASELRNIFSGKEIKVPNAVAKINGKAGNYVFVNGHSVGLSNKLSDFSTLAARMTTYESVLAKLTAKITTPKQVPEFEAPAPEWEGN